MNYVDLNEDYDFDDVDLQILASVAKSLYVASKNILENNLGNLDLPKSRKKILVKEAEETFKKELKSMANEIKAKYLAGSCKDLEKVHQIMIGAAYVVDSSRYVDWAKQGKVHREEMRGVWEEHNRGLLFLKETMQERSVSGRQIITGSYIPTGGK